MRCVRRAAPAVIALPLLCGVNLSAAMAAGPEQKQTGDSRTDLAPLDKSGTSASDGPLATANTPPIGGATQGGGGNPVESGPVDAARTAKSKTPDKTVQPDNR